MRIFDVGGRQGHPATVSDRIVTVPNLVTLARLVALPFIWRALVAENLVAALVLVAVFSATDWVDGYLARRLDQVSKLGQLFDPLVDRALFAVVAIGAAASGLTGWWPVFAIVGRDILVLMAAGVLLRTTQPPPVSRLGKTATFGLMVAYPLVIGAGALGAGASEPNELLATAGTVVLIGSIVAYWLAAVGYGRTVIATGRSASDPRR